MLHKLQLIIGFVFVSLGSALGQLQTVILSGKIRDAHNHPVVGVTVTIISTARGTVSDLDGIYNLSLMPGKKYDLEFSAIGYETKIVTDAEVFIGNTNTLNITLDVKEKMSENVTVVAKRSSARKETINSLIAFQKNSNTVTSVISAESIRLSPDKSAGEVVKRTPGASLQEGKFVIIRGLADRYNQAMLNGILMTSTEPDRKTFSFDLIPAQMIDNIIINKTFVPEFPGEWAGGLIQVNTKDIPSKSFFNFRLGTGLNSQVAGNNFYKDKGGKTDWLGVDDGTRSLPAAYIRKALFDTLNAAQKTAIGKHMRNAWAPYQTAAPVNLSLQINGGIKRTLFGKKMGASFAINYNKTNKLLQMINRSNALNLNTFTTNYNFADTRYLQEISASLLGSFSIQLNALNKISIKSILNVVANNVVTKRTGDDYTRDEGILGTELSFKQNTFFNLQVSGEHEVTKALKLNWQGAFNILDVYLPDQRRITYTRKLNSQAPFLLLISNSLSQQSGSRIFQNLSDYTGTIGGDVVYSYKWMGRKQSVKAGYILQIKDRLYDAKLFANYLAQDNLALRMLPADVVFAPGNFGNGNDNKFGFDAIKGRNFRYLANTILHSGYIQFNNQFSKKFFVVGGLRVEHYDQLVGSVKKWDPRHIHSIITDFLPGINATLKLNQKVNFRLSASQTVIRPELRELSFLNLYDFELNASVQGNPLLKRTKVSNLDFRYELYPRSGEVLTVGLFLKYFRNPIEQFYNEGAGGASTFSYQNVKQAISNGIEIEFRKVLDFNKALKNLTFFTNVSLIRGNVKDKTFGIDRILQGQSPYVINIGLQYDLQKKGVNATFLFNQIGQRIYLVGDLSSGAGSPDIYEAPRPLFDFQVSKKFLDKKAEIKFGISDLLNATQYFYQNNNISKPSLQKNEDAYRFSRKAGMAFNLTINYSL
ncbi:MAG: carboxypeptidase regulatory-like domain-containing protein [Chitinophagaceae bacterium]|nr:carboxypeptidase regulatory-like domain-containing protein [Chitinophagaceae bacterium]